MKKNSPPTVEDSDAKMLRYLDDSLSPEEREAIEEQVRHSAESSRELKELELITSAMKSHKEEIFCPETWELYEYAMAGADPSSSIARHLEHCPECSQEVASFRIPVAKEAMTPAVEAAFREHYAIERDRERETVRYTVPILTRFREYISALFKTPIAPLATAAALAMLIIMVFPRGEVETRLGLSSVTWTQDKGVPKSIFKRPRAVVVVAFKGFGKPVPQDKIDSIYKQLEPSGQLLQKIEIVSPTKLKSALVDQTEKPLDRNALISKLRDELEVSRLLLVTVSPSKDLYNVNGELIDLKTGKTEQEIKEIGINGQNLPHSIGSLSPVLAK